MADTVSFHTLGCRLNQAETAALENSFEASGYTVVDHDDPSDIVVINTCTVTEHGDTDTRRLVNRVVRRNPETRIALVGCQAQVQKEKLAALPNVRWIVGNQRKMDLVKVFEEHAHPLEARVVVPTIERGPFTMPVVAVDRSHTRANIKIQDGCDFFCTFCEIPYARGRARSRVFEDLLFEARALAAAGHQEIILTGINIGTYQHEGKTLLDVIVALEQIEELKRIRISSIEPTTIPLEIFEFMRPPYKLCRYLHVPLQSGSNDILCAMKRKYLVEEFSDFIHLAHARVPGICLGTDVIVGFPGETDAHFEETRELLSELPIHYFHVFSYSPRYMAQARALNDAVSTTKIHERSQILRELSQRKRSLFYQSLLGTTAQVIFEEFKEDFWMGLTDNYVKIKLKSDERLNNQIRTVTLESVDGSCVTAQSHEPS